ncbi:guanine nucleotide exchange factor DBS isoform X4 [Tachysurus ichikawai]
MALNRVSLLCQDITRLWLQLKVTTALASNSGLNSDRHFVLASSGRRGLRFRAKLSVFPDVAMATALALPKQHEVTMVAE